MVHLCRGLLFVSPRGSWAERTVLLSVYLSSVCQSALGPYLASILTHSNLESAVGPPRVSPRRREWGFKCEARLWVLTHLRYPEQDQRLGFLITHPPREDRAGREGDGV